MSPLNSELAMLSRIGSIVSSNLALDGMLREVVALILRMVGGDACFVYVVDRTTKEVLLRGSAVSGDKELACSHFRLKLAQDVAKWVASHNSVMALPSRIDIDRRFKRFKDDPEYQACLAVPALSGGEPVGIITLHHHQAHSYSVHEIGTLVFAGGLLGAAITVSSWHQERAVLTRELSDAKRELSLRKTVDRAKRILHRRFGISEEEAYLRLRQQSRQAEKSLHDVADAVILSEYLERQRQASPSDALPGGNTSDSPRRVTSVCEMLPAAWNK